MNYFLVFQNKSYNEEKAGGYLWAPIKTKNGKKRFYWSNMTKVKEGDIIFSSYNRKIVSVNIATEKAIESDQPKLLESTNLWEKKGWILKAKYNTLNFPIDINIHIDEILKLCADKYSPFTKNGRGTQGYLFEIGSRLGNFLLELAKFNNNLDLGELSKVEKEYIANVTDILNKFKDETEKSIVTKVRVGQGLFKDKLLIKSCKCNICGLNIRELLIASHCKPWKKCNDRERLDVNNGMLLCPTHDALFDKGFITFNDNGEIQISNSIAKDNYYLLNINENIKLRLNENQLAYIKWHREKEFK